MGVRDSSSGAGMTPLVRLATSNEGKLREYRRMAAGTALALELLGGYRDLPPFDESAPTFAENSAGKALHYSQFTREIVLADDSGLVVPALGGAPGVQSARYAGPGASDADRVQKLLEEMDGIEGEQRRAHFVCVISLAREGRVLAVISALFEGMVSLDPQGQKGFGYDPVFFSPELGRTFAEISEDEKNRRSHRGRAFGKTLEFLGIFP